MVAVVAVVVVVAGIVVVAVAVAVGRILLILLSCHGQARWRQTDTQRLTIRRNIRQSMQ